MQRPSFDKNRKAQGKGKTTPVTQEDVSAGAALAPDALSKAQRAIEDAKRERNNRHKVHRDDDPIY